MTPGQVMLYSEGFSGAKDLASKMVSLFLLSRQLLSQQQVRRRPLLSSLLSLSSLLLLCSKNRGWCLSCALLHSSLAQHYDWGLRAMKTCLNTGGKLVQELKQRGTTLTRELEYVFPPPPLAMHSTWSALHREGLSYRRGLPAKRSCVCVCEYFRCLQLLFVGSQCMICSLVVDQV